MAENNTDHIDPSRVAKVASLLEKMREARISRQINTGIALLGIGFTIGGCNLISEMHDPIIGISMTLLGLLAVGYSLRPDSPRE